MREFIEKYRIYKSLNRICNNYCFIWFKPLKEYLVIDETQVCLFRKKDLEVILPKHKITYKR